MQLEFRHQRRTQLIGAGVAIFRDSVKWISFSSIFYFMYLSVRDVSLALSGKITQADINVNIFQGFAVRVFQDAKLHEWIEYGVIVGLLVWGLFERKLRRDAIERLTKRTQQLELERDPNRTSSRLTPRGTTRPGDLS